MVNRDNSIRLVSVILFLFFGINTQIFAQEKSEKEYKEIEKIIAQGRIIHKETYTYYMDEDEIPVSAKKGRPESFLDLFDKRFTIELLIVYKNKLFSCNNGFSSYTDKFTEKEKWNCYHIFNK